MAIVGIEISYNIDREKMEYNFFDILFYERWCCSFFFVVRRRRRRDDVIFPVVLSSRRLSTYSKNENGNAAPPLSFPLLTSLSSLSLSSASQRTRKCFS